MLADPRRRLRSALVACAVVAAAATWASAPALARDGGDRVEADVTGVCGHGSSVRLRLRAEDGEIRADLRIRTSRLGLWRVTVLHERRLARRIYLRARTSGGGFEHRFFLPDYDGPDAISMRAVSPQGTTCSVGTTLGEARSS